MIAQGAQGPGDRSAPLRERLRRDAREIFAAGLAAADPARALREAFDRSADRLGFLARERDERASSTLRIVAFGKAATTMAEAVGELVSKEVFPGPGIAVVNDENARDVDRFRVFASGHPLPDERGVQAAREVEAYVSNAREGDRLLVLISGGGSALLPSPAENITLEEKRDTTRLLLEAGAPIEELNTVRKHLSRLKGGGLARLASPARIDAWIVSDVIGNDLATIASGPTAPDPTTFADARRVLEERGVIDRVPRSVRARIERGARGEIVETPKPGDDIFSRVEHEIIASNERSLDAAIERARELGYEVIVHSRALIGEARDAASSLARELASRVEERGSIALLAGGETTVTVRGAGRGGRNQELALAFALAAEARPIDAEWVLLSAGTDGRDGPTDAAGALIDPATLERARRAGLDPQAALRENDSHPLLDAAGDLLRTGGTGTNVADLAIALAAKQ